MSEPSLLDSRLAEIDRRLRTIQTGLEAGDRASTPPHSAEPEHDQEAQPLPPPTPLHPDRDPVPKASFETELAVDRLTRLADAHGRLLELHRELLGQYADVLQARAAATVVSVTSGPFADTGQVRAFEQALSGLPMVTRVAVREYAGDRVILDVELAAR